MFKTMTASNAIPHFGYCDEVDMTQMVALKPIMKAEAERRNIKFSYMPVIIKVPVYLFCSFIPINSCTRLTPRFCNL